MHTPEDSPRASPSRRDIIVLGVGALAVAALPFAGGRSRRLIRRRLPLMGTLAEIAVVHRDPRFAHAAIDAAFDQLNWVERTMTRFDSSSDVGRANLLASTEPVHVTRATGTVLREALAWADASDGAFDPCIGKAVELWDVANRREPPPAERAERLAGRALYRALEVDQLGERPIVRFSDPDVRIDLGGIGKGYGVDRAVEALRSWGINQALVNVGGDLYAMGSSGDGDPWSVGIRSPADPQRLAGTLEVRDGAVATSGDYLQFFQHRKKRYHHLLDPATGAPRASAMHSVTVTADNCMTADAAATAVFGMAPARADRLLRNSAPDARVVGRV